MSSGQSKPADLNKVFVSLADIESTMKNRRDHGEWILSWSLRSSLYLSLFYPMVPNNLWGHWNRAVIESNLDHLRGLEEFYMEALTMPITATTSESKICPGMPEFVNDTLALIDILCLP